MQLSTLATSSGLDVYYTDIYLLTVISSVPYFITNNLITYRHISENMAGKYIGDLYGLLDYLQLPKKFHRVHVTLNNLKASTDYDGSDTTIIIYDPNSLDMIANAISGSKKYF